MRERLHELWLRLRAMRRAGQLDADLEDEMKFHLDMREQSLRESGLPAPEARDAARRQFGNALRIRETLREQWRWGPLDRFWQDVRFGARLAGRERAFTAIVVATLALGIGASTAMFTIVDAVLLRPYQFPDSQRLFVAWETNLERGVNRNVASLANYLDWRENATAFADLGAFETRTDNRTDGSRAEQVTADVASSAFFRALGVEPVAGRFFHRDEDQPANRFVTILGQEYWRRAFAGDRDVIGRSITINGEAHEVIGVMPPMRGPFLVDLWRPMAPDAATLDRGDHSIIVVGRLGAGQSMAQAEAELQTIAANLAATYTDNRGWSVRLESLYDAVVQPSTRRSMTMLMGAVALLLVIACVNVANLMLARGTRRQREISTRLALGASRFRVAGQLLAEAGVLSVIGAGAGLLVAIWGLRLAEWVYPDSIAGPAGLALNGFALAFAAAAAVVTTFAVGIAPAFSVSGKSFSSGVMGMARTATESLKTGRLQRSLVVAEVALAVMLLTGSGLLLKSVGHLRSEPLGFTPDNVVTAKIGFYSQRYESMNAYASFITELIDRLSQRPGINAVGISSSVPFDGGYTVMQARLNGAGPELATGIQSDWRVIGGDYLTAMGIPLKTGRVFSAADNRERPIRATIINETLADRLWPGQDPLGRQVLIGDARRPYEVIGVTAASRVRALGRQSEPAMYFHYLQFAWPTMTVAARASGSGAAVESAIRETVTALDRDQPVADVRTMWDVVDDAAAAPVMNASLITVFAALALILSAIGVYGLIGYAAAQRTPEIGVRLALGARPAAMFMMVWWQGLRLAAVGLALGVAGALASGGSIGALLYEVSPFDPATYGGVVAIMVAVTIAACYIPARRAMRTDAAVVLRHE
jgi:putative ABC transport system permease protein